jgi:isoquinoline 1-oxidoreductase beta subunit
MNAPDIAGRRGFLKVAAAAGGSLMVGFWTLPGEALPPLPPPRARRRPT